MTTNLIHIGSTEVVGLPIGEGYVEVPAKVDTGADYSSIWASNISEEDGILSFTLFGPGSKHYTGEVHTATEFGFALIKNSFGETEERYKVYLPTRIAGRRIKVEYSLADRSRNRYPVLIGRKTLLRRFVVDVSNKHTKQAKVLVLSSASTTRVKTFFDDINSLYTDLKCDFHTYDDFGLIMSENSMNVVNMKTQKSINNYDLIYFRTYFKKAEIAASIAEFAQARGMLFIDTEVATYHAYTKVSQYARLARKGIAIPKSIVVSPKLIGDQFEWFKNELGLPFILKDSASERGMNNHLVRDQKQFAKIARVAAKQGAYYVAQQFIENDGDVRFIVFDKEVSLVIKRTATDKKSHLNNTSRGASAELIDTQNVTPQQKSLAIKAAMALNRKIAGVDLIQDKKTGEWFVLEVNNSPQLAAGTFMDEKINVLGKFLRSYARK